MNKYIVNEIQNNSIIPIIFDEAEHSDAEDLAYSRYFTIMAAAAISDVPYHGANIIKLDGVNQSLIEGRIYDRR